MSMELRWIPCELEWPWKFCIAKKGEKTEVFEGCQGNGYTWRHKFLHVDSTWLALHFRSIHHGSIFHSLGAMAENVIFPWFSAKNRPFSPSYHSNEKANQFFAADMFTQPCKLLDKCIFWAVYPSRASQDFENHDFWRKLRDKKTSEANISKTVGDRSLYTTPVMIANELVFRLVQLS